MQDSGCEMTAKVLEDVIQEALKERERLFIIGRTGMGEKKPFGWQRLSLLENRLKLLSMKPLLIVAEGKPVLNGKGVLELWIGSSPRAVIRFKKNQQFCIDTPEHGERGKRNR